MYIAFNLAEPENWQDICCKFQPALNAEYKLLKVMH